MQAIANGISLILAKFAAVLEWIGKLFIACFAAFWDFFKDLVCWALDGFLGIAVSALNAVDLGVMPDVSGWWSSVPAEVLNVMGLVGVGEAMAIIAGAITIRLALQLIPFTRLGS